MEISLYNTLTRKKERFEPADPSRVTMYVCGPTVYDTAHIGNARPPVAFDVLRRLLQRAYGDKAVVFARNFTDIDDKIIARMHASGETLEAITDRYARIYEEDMAALGVAAPDLSPRATAHVPDMIALIEALIAKGAAYVAPSGVYFSVAADADYGKLSGRAQEDLLAGARVEGEDDKRAPSDFALWKAAKPGEPAWDAPFGKGRPGWHIECSAMIEAQLGGTIDIHGGGIDLVFPHHENEIAQSETAHGRPLARFWMHNGFLTLDETKMSKSLGNVLKVHDLLKAWPGEVLRWALLSAHYRAPLDWNDDLLTQSKASLDRLYGALQRLNEVTPASVDPPTDFLAALADDLNTPEAIASLFALAGEANTAKKPEAMAKAKGQLLAAGALFGVLAADPNAWFRAGIDDAEAIDALVAARFAARKAKDFAEADRLRTQLEAMGVVIMDGAAGSTWRRA